MFPELYSLLPLGHIEVHFTCMLAQRSTPRTFPALFEILRETACEVCSKPPSAGPGIMLTYVALYTNQVIVFHGGRMT